MCPQCGCIVKQRWNKWGRKGGRKGERVGGGGEDGEGLKEERERREGEYLLVVSMTGCVGLGRGGGWRGTGAYFALAVLFYFFSPGKGVRVSVSSGVLRVRQKKKRKLQPRLLWWTNKTTQLLIKWIFLYEMLLFNCFFIYNCIIVGMQVKKNTIWQLSFHNLNEYKQQLNRSESCLKTSTLRNNIWDGHTDIVICRGRFALIFLTAFYG